MTTSVPANANSPASMSPVGPPPAITTEYSEDFRPMSQLFPCHPGQRPDEHLGELGAGDSVLAADDKEGE